MHSFMCTGLGWNTHISEEQVQGAFLLHWSGKSEFCELCVCVLMHEASGHIECYNVTSIDDMQYNVTSEDDIMSCHVTQ